jgi:DNA repair protein RecO
VYNRRMARTEVVEGIILKRFDLGESDRVLTVFTKQMGKISILAKGVKRIVSKKAGSVEIGNKCTFLLIEGKNFFILQEVKLIDPYDGMKASLGVLKYGYHVIELTEALLPEHEPHEDIYRLVSQILHLLDVQPRKLYVRAFEVKLLTKLGYLDVLKVVDEGSLAGSEFLDDASTELLIHLQELNWKDVTTLEMDEKQSLKIEQFLKFRLERVIERKLHSLHYFG